MKCKPHKCKAQCCYNVPLPIGMLERFADKIANEPIDACPMPFNPEFPPSEYVLTSADPRLNKCPFLRADCKCNIYERRPDICRRYGDGSHPLLTCRHLN